MLKTACYDWHIAHGGRMVDFAGWEMPVQYSTITEEHHAVRRAAGLFDISHMGRLKFSGPEAARFLDRIVTNDIAALPVGRICYALVTNDTGGVLDDVLVYRFAGFYLLVVNASNRLKILDWIELNGGGFDMQLDDVTFSHSMFALQGPKAVEVLSSLVDAELSGMKYYRGVEAKFGSLPALVSRTGYTGEDGFELIAPAEDAVGVWKTLIERGRDAGLLPAGLGCRDTLRLEAGMPLYGHELDEAIDPFSAGLGFAVKLDAGEFIGKEALISAKGDATRPRRIGLELSGRRIARDGSLVYAAGAQVGRVTSGTFSPTLEKSIAMAYVSPEMTAPGREVEVDIRGRRERATVVKLPFYRRG